MQITYEQLRQTQTCRKIYAKKYLHSRGANFQREKNTSKGILSQLNKSGIRNETFYTMKRRFLGIQKTGYSSANGWKLISIQEELLISEY